jgi:antitoxin HigA-1
VTEVSRNLGVSRQNMSLLFNGHASLSSTMALRVETAIGISADTLMRMQAAYDIAQARMHGGELAGERMRQVA